MVTTVPTARPVLWTAAKYAVWKTVRATPVTTIRRTLRLSGACACAGACARRGRARRGGEQQQEPPAHRQKERLTGPMSLSWKTSAAAAPAVPQAVPATIR